jgi:type II secretory pathway pseudopilin PulG
MMTETDILRADSHRGFSAQEHRRSARAKDNRKPDGRSRRGLTLPELVVVTLIVLVSLCLVIVWLVNKRESARRAQCTLFLHLLGNGLSDYALRHKAFPYGTVPNPALPPERRFSWYVEAWPAVGIKDTRLLLEADKPWDAPENLSQRLLAADDQGQEQPVAVVPKFHCPAHRYRPSPDRPGLTTYIGLAGLGEDTPLLTSNDPRLGIWGYDRRTPLDQITDGLQVTLLLAETGRDLGPWTAGGPPTVRGLPMDERPQLGVGNPLGGLHPGGCNAVFADPRVQFIAEDIDPLVLAAMVTIAGGQDEESRWQQQFPQQQ